MNSTICFIPGNSAKARSLGCAEETCITLGTMGGGGTKPAVCCAYPGNKGEAISLPSTAWAAAALAARFPCWKLCQPSAPATTKARSSESVRNLTLTQKGKRIEK